MAKMRTCFSRYLYKYLEFLHFVKSSEIKKMGSSKIPQIVKLGVQISFQIFQEKCLIIILRPKWAKLDENGDFVNFELRNLHNSNFLQSIRDFLTRPNHRILEKNNYHILYTFDMNF